MYSFLYRLLFPLLLLTEFHGVFAQDSTFHYQFSGTGALTSSQSPFWFHSNTFGQTPTNGPYVVVDASIYKNYARSSKFLDWKAGIELVSFTGTKSDLFLTDAFLSTKLGKIEVLIGQKKETVGLVDSSLTSGSFAWSGNNRPFPRIQISLPEFYSLAFTRNFVALKGNYSDGILGPARVQFGNVTEIPITYLHQKSFYIRLGAPHRALNLLGGFNHQAMWGGENRIFSGGLDPSKAYVYTVLGKSWAGSRNGNHLGTIDIGAEWKGKTWNLLGYRQNIYEDGSLAQFLNIADGLNGISLTRKGSVNNKKISITKLVVELLSTTSQGGSIFDFQTGIFGRDNYFNHYIYAQGWSYRGRSFGTALLANKSLLTEVFPQEDTYFTINNRLWALHFGLSGKLNGIDLITKATISRNFGTYKQAFMPPVYQFSYLVKGEKLLSSAHNTFLAAQIGIDAGGLYPFNLGFALSIRKNGYFSKSNK